MLIRCIAVVLAVIAVGAAGADARAVPQVSRVPGLNLRDSDAGLEELARLGDTALFTVFGELWRSDATEAGTAIVKDISPGPGIPFANSLTTFSGAVFFFAGDATHGMELWKSDGSSEGTVLVKDINPGVGSALNYYYDDPRMTVAGDGLYFTASDGTTGRELWRTDGTMNGTQRVADIRPGSESSEPTNVAGAGGEVYFSADDGTTGRELWRVGGPQGAQLVKDVVPGPDSSSPGPAVHIGSTTLFLATDPTPDVSAGSSRPDIDLWATDGTAINTTTVHDFPSNTSPAGSLTRMGAAAYFSGSDGDGAELWTSDGSSSGTHEVKEIRAGAAGSAPADITVLGDTLLFSARIDDSVSQLWKSDGTEAGTVRVNPAGPHLDPAGLRVVGDEVWFAGSDTSGRELWATDGTADGTRLIKDINAGSAGAFMYSFDLTGAANASGQTSLFAATDGTHGVELWRTDGTESGTSMVRNIGTFALDTRPAWLTDVSGSLFFTAEDSYGRALWRTTAGGNGVTKLMAGSSKDFYSDFDGAPRELGGVGSALYFSAARDDAGRELWRSDGTPAGTHRVKNIAPGPGPANSDPKDFVEVGGVAMFSANDRTNGRELWRSDGTAGGTYRLKDIAAGEDVGEIVAMGGKAYFAAQDGQGRELWTTDGTLEGTARVKDINPGPAWSDPTSLTVVGSRLFFFGFDPVSGTELFTSDGTEAGTYRLSDLPGVNGGSPATLLAGERRVLFSAATGPESIREFWTSDGTVAGTSSAGYLTSQSCYVTPLGDDFVSIHGGVRWIVDRVAKDIFVPTSYYDGCPRYGINYAGAAFFGTGFDDLWESDGTAAGTFLAYDFFEGNADYRPTQFTVSGDALYFVMNDAQAGDGIWRLKQDPPPPPAPSKPPTEQAPVQAAPISKPARGRVAPQAVAARLMRLRLTRRFAHYRVSGRIVLPPRVATSEACSGTVSVPIKRGKALVVTKSARISAQCAFSADVRVRRAGRGRARHKFTVEVSFGGNNVLTARRSPPVAFRPPR